MNDLLAALGLVLVIEGLLWAAFPTMAIRILQAAVETSEATLRFAGLATIGAGVLIVWLIRG